jgi:hypothetical protein
LALRFVPAWEDIEKRYQQGIVESLRVKTSISFTVKYAEPVNNTDCSTPEIFTVSFNQKPDKRVLAPRHCR